MLSKRSIGDAKYLKKKIPQNPKYQHVKSRLDTGFSLTKYMERLEDMKENYRYKKDELFKRLKVTTFAKMVLQVASVSDFTESIMDEAPPCEVSAEGDGPTERLDSSPHHSTEPIKLPDGSETSDSAFSPRSTLQSVISSIGELDIDKDEDRMSVTPTPACPASSAEHPYSYCPYLLLDVRDRDLYHQCHIISAHSYPIINLSRTMNPYTKDILDYRNVEGKIIILYDEDERTASQAATIMCQRGFDNLFMLSGGLEVIAQKFPEGLTTGSFPFSCLPSLAGPSSRKHPALQQEPHPAENKWRFTSEDRNKIQYYLDEVLVPSDSSSPLSSSSIRMSTISTKSNVSSTWSSRLGSESSRAQGRRPWK